MKRLDLVVLGDVNPDVVVRDRDPTPAFGQVERLVDGISLTIGGSGAITACAAAKLGLRTALVGLVGEDRFGDFMIAELGRHGVDVSGLARTPEFPTGCTVVLSAPHDRAMFTAPGTIARFSCAMVDLELLAAARHVHVSSYFLQTGLQPDLPRLFDFVRQHGGTTSIDPNWDPSGEWKGGLSDVLPRTDVFFPNEQEVRELARETDPVRAGLVVAREGPTVVVKCGSRGAVAVRGDNVLRVEPAPVDSVDTTGAGDTFDAGWIAGELRALPMEQRLRFAATCGALATRGYGGVDGQPSAAEALRLTDLEV